MPHIFQSHFASLLASTVLLLKHDNLKLHFSFHVHFSLQLQYYFVMLLFSFEHNFLLLGFQNSILLQSKNLFGFNLTSCLFYLIDHVAHGE